MILWIYVFAMVPDSSLSLRCYNCNLKNEEGRLVHDPNNRECTQYSVEYCKPGIQRNCQVVRNLRRGN